ncbi:MAG: AraC family transcriptional regulator [Agarilytica sp.]
MRKLSGRISLALLLSISCISLTAQEVEDDGAWAIEIQSPTINFGGSQEEITEKRALSEIQKISRDIQLLKGEVIDLNKDLRLMEEKLLFPSSTKVSFFVSLTSGQFFQVEGVKLKIDGRFVATHVYSEKQREALLRGGVHKLHITNLSEGKHDIIAFFTGIGPGGRAYKRANELEVKKGPGSQYIEIAISDDTVAQEPTFDIKKW